MVPHPRESETIFGVYHGEPFRRETKRVGNDLDSPGLVHSPSGRPLYSGAVAQGGQIVTRCACRPAFG